MICKITVSGRRERLCYLRTDMKKEKELKITYIIFSGNKYTGNKSFKHQSTILSQDMALLKLMIIFPLTSWEKYPNILLHIFYRASNSAMGIQTSSPIISLFSHSKSAIAKKLL